MRQSLSIIIIPSGEIQLLIFPLEILPIVMLNFLPFKLFNSQHEKTPISLNNLPSIMTFNKFKHRTLMDSGLLTEKEK